MKYFWSSYIKDVNSYRSKKNADGFIHIKGIINWELVIQGANSNETILWGKVVR